MVKGFVFGKFLPFHKGHQAMITFALQHCDVLTVLVCCSDTEDIPCAVRRQWVTETFADKTNVVVQVFNYREAELPNSSVSSLEISKIWAGVFSKLLPDCSVLVTSEPYGEYVANFMDIRHIMFDKERTKVPIAASYIRNDLSLNWSFLPDSVKPFFIRKIVILGTESTGKTTLTKDLAHHFDCAMVLEAGRDLIENSNQFTEVDLHKVADEHARRIAIAERGSSHLVIIDTDIHITQSYYQHTFGNELLIADEIYRINKADLYLYLNNDVPFEQDGTRLSETERNLLDESHRRVLSAHSVDLVEVKGNWTERFNTAVAAIDDLLKRPISANEIC